MDFADFRRATDVEFGMATYEPFGISPLEPLGSGALCVITNVCGCEGFVKHVTGPNGTKNVITADFTQLDHARSIDELKRMTREERDALEERIAPQIADEIAARLPQNDKQREALVKSGQQLVAKMGWDQVIEEGLLPMLERISKLPSGNGR
jgi:hypothetical protein